MKLAERLARWNGKEIVFLEEVYDLHAHLADFTSDLHAAMGGTARVQTGASWVLKRWLEEGERLGPRDTARFLASLEGLEAWEAQLHSLQCLPFVSIPPRSRGPVERFVRACLQSEVKFVRAWAFTGMHELAKEFEELRPEVSGLLEAARSEGPASVRARVRNLLKQGF